MNVRVLKEEDAEVFQALRLRALREHPEAFGSAYEDECTLSGEAVVERLRPSADRCGIGAWVDNDLVGIINFARYPGRKTRHRAMIGAMYVVSGISGSKAAMGQRVPFIKRLASSLRMSSSGILR